MTSRAVLPQPDSATTSVEIPTQVVDLLAESPREVSARVNELVLIELFRRGAVSSGYAAQLLGMPREDFIRLLGEHGVPYLDQSGEELRREVEEAEAYLSQPPHSPLLSPTPAS